MNPTSAKQMLISSTYPLDKIIYMLTGSFVIPNNTVGHTDTIAHDLAFTPLMDGTWSTASDFSLAYDVGSGPAATVPGFILNTRVEAISNSTDIVITGDNVTGSSVTAFYRVYGFMPSNVDLESPDTSAIADSFVINTGFNYTKLLDSGMVGSNTTVSHDLGYRPQATIWQTQFGDTKKLNENSVNDSSASKASVTESALQLTPGTSATLHYRLYVDE